MPSLFSRIISGDLACYKLLETDTCIAFLDIQPIRPGHTLLVPKYEIDYLFDLPDSHLAGLLPVAKRLSKAIQAVVPCNRIGLMVAGLEVPHAHIHLIPIRQSRDLNFEHATPASPSDLSALASRICDALN